MIGEQVNEMQLANWIPTHSLSVNFPAWAGTWFSVFNNWETIITQIAAAIFVIGSYYAARAKKPKSRRNAVVSSSPAES
jgi:high-affinity iron transporter